MDEPYDSRIFNWCEVKQTELHEGPYPPPSQRYAVLIRITLILQSGGFQIQAKPPHSFMYNFCPEVTLIGKSQIWVNFMSADERGKSITYLVTALRRMGLRLKELADIVNEISDKVEPPIHLPQLAVDMTIRLICCELHGSFDGYHDMRLYRWVKKSWDDSRTSCVMPPSSSSCAVCLEDFGGGVDDKMIARLPCSHYFHADCTAQWVVDHHTCPLCRSQLMPLLSDDENEHFNPNPS
ncbi:hypothetical protein ACLB2K_057607 [Fragaria x ananassa]